jgi:hypothetical protein
VVPLPTPFALPDVARFGVRGGINYVVPARDAGLSFGLYANWDIAAKVPPAEAAFWQMLRITEEGSRETWAFVAEVIAAQPGSVWIVGNEPDVIWQDNVTPERYAEIYHEAYTFIKERDPLAQLAMAGVAQPTPLRLAYLERVLLAYQEKFGEPMPVDIWTVHAFILREEAGSWGVDIPPGLAATEGALYEIADHDDFEIFTANLVVFRRWLWEQGYGERPLAVTEYGILMPPDYGFPPEAVADFMTRSFDFFLSARDEEIGYAADDYRLVQWWMWYSLHDNELYQTGNLFEAETGQLTELGEVWRGYMNGR